MTGKPFALWARVRAVSGVGTSAWSDAFGFNTAWQQIPQQESSPEGLIRWTPVEGATGYQVWYLNGPAGYATRFSTFTNVADEREYWTFHPADAAVIHWRVRAVRLVKSGSLPDGIPVVSFGPYSRVFTTTNPTALSQAPIAGVAAESNVESTAAKPLPHQLTPGFAWKGTLGTAGQGVGSMLWRVYVFSDKQCVNPVMTGSLVGGPAWAPRDSDPLALPGDDTSLQDVEQNSIFLGFAPQTNVFTVDGGTPVPAEETTATSSGTGSAGTAPPAAGSGATGGTGAPGSAPVAQARLVSLPDIGWPQGRYWWTVIPVAIVETKSVDSSSSTGGTFEYHDLELPQDACAAGQVWPFGMQSAPVTTTSETPYASGVVAGMRVISAAGQAPGFLERPLVSWRPALGATSYDLEVSRKLYPWKAVRTQVSVVNSAVLPLSKQNVGTWYYRVRGVNPDLVGPAQKMAWSVPVAIRITGDRFRLVK
jgi:hypothetical protein